MELAIEELPDVRPSFYLLDVNCLLNIFKRLEFDDLMNIAETCILFKDVVNRIFERNYSINLNPFQKEEEYINRVLFHIGPYVSWLKISGREGDSRGFEKPIDRKNHKILTIQGLSELKWSKYKFNNVELLMLQFCEFPFEKCFLEKFKKLKHFNIVGRKIDQENLRMVCGKNPGIESFVYRNLAGGEDFDCQLFELIPKVKTVSISEEMYIRNFNNISNLNSLLLLNQLTKLRLECKMNLNNLLKNLALKGVLEELELHRIIFDNKTMNILNKFDKLQLLRIHYAYGIVILKLSDILLLPPKLKHLYLCEFLFTYETYFATIQSLKYLQSLDICITIEAIPYFKDVPKLFRQTLKVLEDNGGNHRLDVVLPWCFEYDFGRDPSGRDVDCIEADRLRIMHGKETNYNELGIRILLPGLHEHDLYCFCMDRKIYDYFW